MTSSEPHTCALPPLHTAALEQLQNRLGLLNKCRHCGTRWLAHNGELIALTEQQAAEWTRKRWAPWQRS